MSHTLFTVATAIPLITANQIEKKKKLNQFNIHSNTLKNNIFFTVWRSFSQNLNVSQKEKHIKLIVQNHSPIKNSIFLLIESKK